MTKIRIRYFLFTIATITIGLLSRNFASLIPASINLVLGDMLYAVMIYWMVRFIKPALAIRYSAFITLVICFSIEASQLSQAQWLLSIRTTAIGRLILGRGFLWTDLIAYSIGSLVGVIIDRLMSNPADVQKRQ